MAQPTAYNRVFNFQNYEAANPTLTKPGQYMDSEYNAVKVTLDQVLANLARIQRDDGALANQSVGIDQLSSSLSLGFTFRGTWATATNYVSADGVAYSGKLYRATVTHLSSGANRPDLDSVTWTLLVDLSSGIALADGSVTTVKIADLNVTTVKIADSNVTTAKIADSNVTTVKIADANVTLAKLATDARVYPSPQGRLTLQTATPIMTTTQSAKTTVFYTPYVGDRVPLYDGTNMNWTLFAELSVATTDTTKNPAAIGASKVNDWFVWSDSGTLRISHGPDWTNDTTRSAGTALVRQNGVLLNSIAITNGPGASRGTYIGTTRSNGSSQLDWIYGASASGGTAGFFGIWNMYNRVVIGTDVTDSGAGYTYTSATIRQARASAGNQVTFVQGLQEDAVWASLSQNIDTLAASGANLKFGLGLDSTTTYAGKRMTVVSVNSNITIAAESTSKQMFPGIGVHVVSSNEGGDGTNANTFNSNSDAILSVMLRM